VTRRDCRQNPVMFSNVFYGRKSAVLTRSGLMTVKHSLVVNLWNSLPSEAVEAPALNIFKKKIDRFLKNKGIKGYGVRAGKWS